MIHNTWKRKLLRHTPILSQLAQGLDVLEQENQHLKEQIKAYSIAKQENEQPQLIATGNFHGDDVQYC